MYRVFLCSIKKIKIEILNNNENVFKEVKMENKERNFEKAQIEVKKQKSEEQIKEEIKNNYKIGIGYYEDIKEHKS